MCLVLTNMLSDWEEEREKCLFYVVHKIIFSALKGHLYLDCLETMLSSFLVFRTKLLIKTKM